MFDKKCKFLTKTDELPLSDYFLVVFQVLRQKRGAGRRGLPLLIRKTTTKQAKTSKTEAEGAGRWGGSVTPFTQPQKKHKTINKKQALGGGGRGAVTSIKQHKTDVLLCVSMILLSKVGVLLRFVYVLPSNRCVAIPFK